jgi:ParB family chromosome partitioning protein
MGKFDSASKSSACSSARMNSAPGRGNPLDRSSPTPAIPGACFDDDALAELAASIAARGSCSRSRLRPPTPTACIASVWASGVPRARGPGDDPGDRRGRGEEPICSPIRSLRTISVRTFLRSSSLMRLPVCSRAAWPGRNRRCAGPLKQFVSLYAAYGDMPAYLRRRARADPAAL